MATAPLLICAVPTERVDELVTVLLDAGATAVVEQTMGSSTELQAGFSTMDGAARARRELPSSIPSRLEAVRSDGWVRSQRDGLRPVQVGPFDIRAPWSMGVSGAPNQLVIDPGAAFGHGGHPSTSLLLGMLAGEVQRDLRVVDVGTGTGILAIAAATLGASVLAVDSDPVAVDVARANIERNGVDDRIEVRLVDESDPAPFAADLALVNVTISGHRAIAPRVATIATVAISGITTEQADDVYALYGLRPLRKVDRSGDWIAALLD